MAFRMRSEALKWFEHIRKGREGPIRTDFDLYYLCVMIGLAAGRMGDIGNAPEFMKDFVQDYRSMQRIIIGLLIVTELGRRGLALSEREEIHDVLKEYIDPQSSANLTDIGFTQLNKYASGGFDYLAEKCAEKPHYIEDFLQLYVRTLNRAVAECDRWKPYLEGG